MFIIATLTGDPLNFLKKFTIAVVILFLIIVFITETSEYFLKDNE